VSWTEFIQQLINGLSLGAFYALIALGYTMVYGVLRFINFAHGDVFMIGAFSGYYLSPRVLPYFTGGLIPLGPVAVLILTMLICALLGIAIEKLAYRPLRSRPKLTVLITAIGVSLFLEYGGQFVFGADPKSFPELMPDRALEGTGALTITTTQVAAFVVTIILLVALTFIVKHTRLGMAMRALSNNPTAAALMWSNIDTVISFTFGLGSALAGAAGILFALKVIHQSIRSWGLLPESKLRSQARRHRKHSRCRCGWTYSWGGRNICRRFSFFDIS
jgi:branched-chain amino acid transport system permease protein